MSKVELIYDADCPNVDAARGQLRRAFAEVGQSAEWIEWDRGDSSSPCYVRQFGSPTILVDGEDVAGSSRSDEANCCRLYRGTGGRLQGAPSVESIAHLLRDAKRVSGASVGRRSWLAVVPAIGVAMLPKLACPACWPAYAGLLGSVGLGFLMQTAYLLPMTAAFLVVAVGALGFRARARRGYGPLLVGLLAAVAVIVGKFVFDSDPVLYGGISLLIGASVWNAWPKSQHTPSCPACVETGQRD